MLHMRLASPTSPAHVAAFSDITKKSFSASLLACIRRASIEGSRGIEAGAPEEARRRAAPISWLT
jgi:hypothetical protein